MEIFALIPVTTSRYINLSLSILLVVLHNLENAWIQWPWGDEFTQLNDLVHEHHPLLDGAFRMLNGLNLPVQKSSDQEIENATYNSWLHSHFVSSVLAFSASGRLLNTSYAFADTSHYRSHHCLLTQCTWKLAQLLHCTTNLCKAMQQNTEGVLSCCRHSVSSRSCPD